VDGGEHAGIGLAAALGAGLGVGYVTAVVRGIMVSPRELEEIMQLPVIGTISLEPAWRISPPFSAAFDFGNPPARQQLRLRLQNLLDKAR
jgi:hypothetical protein